VDFADRADLTGRLRGLIILLDEQLTAEQIRSAEELVDASEFGAALETLAGWLSEAATPITDDVRADFEMLASKMDMGIEHVREVLGRCPVREPDASTDSDSGFPF
jgi:hypothetical protein